MFALIHDRFWHVFAKIIFVPHQTINAVFILKLKPLVLVAVWAGDKITPLICFLESCLDARMTLDRWRRVDKDLSPTKRSSTLDGQLDRIALAVHIFGVCVH